MWKIVCTEWKRMQSAWVLIMNHENRIYCKSSVRTLMLAKTISLNPFAYFIRMKDYGTEQCIVTVANPKNLQLNVTANCWFLSFYFADVKHAGANLTFGNDFKLFLVHPSV